MEVLNDLLGYKNIKIYQDTDSFCFSLDSVLIANFIVNAKGCNNIIDLGTGNAVIPMILASKYKNMSIYGVEIQRKSFDLAKKSILHNKLGNVKVLNKDINALKDDFDAGFFDVVVSNPPYFKYNGESRINDSETKSIARHEIMVNFEQIVEMAKYLLRDQGYFYFVHRPERLNEFFMTLNKYGFVVKRIQFVYPKVGKESNMVLFECRKGGRDGLKILNPFYVHDDNGYTKEVLEMFVG